MGKISPNADKIIDKAQFLVDTWHRDSVWVCFKYDFSVLVMFEDTEELTARKYAYDNSMGIEKVPFEVDIRQVLMTK